MWNIIFVVVILILAFAERCLEKQFPVVYDKVESKARVTSTILILLFIVLWALGLREVMISDLDKSEKGMLALMVAACELSFVYLLLREWRKRAVKKKDKDGKKLM